MKPGLATFILSAATVLAGTGPVRSAPPVTAGLVLHLDASAITGLDEGNTVAQWDDLSGQDNHAAQSLEARKPVYKTEILGGLPVVRFDGIDGVLKDSLPSSGTPGVDSQNLHVGNLGHPTWQEHFRGDIAEILICNRALSDEDRDAVERYLGRKWLGWESGAFSIEFF